MKYLYKQTGIEVESDELLDSTMFKLIEEKNEDSIMDIEDHAAAINENTEETEQSEEKSELHERTEQPSAKTTTRKKTTAKSR